jgi:alpha-beta hydrolase superfamily lysophospholipase
MDRQDLVFRSGTDECAAWFYSAADNSERAPVVVMAHGLSGTRRDRLGPFAERFAAAGFAALVFDHRGFGDSGGEPDLFHPPRQLEDWRAAIAFARSLPGVDAARVATFGSSMGGETPSPLPRRIRAWPRRSAKFPSSTSCARRTARRRR